MDIITCECCLCEFSTNNEEDKIKKICPDCEWMIDTGIQLGLIESE